MCGETDWRCMELDHVAGQRFDETTVILCRNCHRKKSDDQKSLPPFDPVADPVLAAIGQFLLGLWSRTTNSADITIPRQLTSRLTWAFLLPKSSPFVLYGE